MFRRTLSIAALVFMAAVVSALVSVAVVAGTSSGAASTASADLPPQAATTATSHICVFSRAVVFAQSLVGKMANRRIQQLAQEARRQLTQARKQLAADIEAFGQQVDTLSAEEGRSRQQAFRKRLDALKQQARRVEARIRYTRNAVKQGINQKINVVLDAVDTAQGCDVVFKRSSVVSADRVQAITAAVIAALNKKVDSINFGLLQLPAQTADTASAGDTQ